jgi:hypothetical protein
MIQLHMVPREKSAPGFRCWTHRVRQHERHGKDERREKDERNGKANGEQGRRPAVGIVLAKRSHVAEAQQAPIASFMSRPKGALHASAPVFSLLFTGADCARDGMQPQAVPASYGVAGDELRRLYLAPRRPTQ